MEKDLLIKPISIDDANYSSNTVFVLYIDPKDDIKLTEPSFSSPSEYEITDMILADNKKFFETVYSKEVEDYLIEEGLPLYSIKVKGQDVLSYDNLSGDISLEDYINDEYENKRNK